MIGWGAFPQEWLKTFRTVDATRGGALDLRFAFRFKDKAQLRPPIRQSDAKRLQEVGVGKDRKDRARSRGGIFRGRNRDNSPRYQWPAAGGFLNPGDRWRQTSGFCED